MLVNKDITTLQDKLAFIYSIPLRLNNTEHRGYKCDWFLYSYDTYKHYQSSFGNPKYIKIKYNETQREAIYILYDEDVPREVIRYQFYGRGIISCNSLTIKDELLYFNGQLKDSQGRLTYEECTEDDLVDFIYRIAYNYYINDIKPVEDKKFIKQELELDKEFFANTYFKLKGENK